MIIEISNPTDWSRWFAWHPVITLDRQWVWLEQVDRKWNPDAGQSMGDLSGHSWNVGEWEYRI